MLEAVWASSEEVLSPGRTGRSEEGFLSPGVRYAVNTRSGLQIVPGNRLHNRDRTECRRQQRFFLLECRTSFRQGVMQGKARGAAPTGPLRGTFLVLWGTEGWRV